MARTAVVATSSTREKPRLSFWQIWNMSFGFLGIQFGFALQNTNISRIFETMGANTDDIAFLWLAAPLRACWCSPLSATFPTAPGARAGAGGGRSFLVGAVLASLALLVMPNVTALWMAAGMLWILDSSINISMEPFRALVGDMLPSEQRTAGFAAQTFFIGVGAVVASSAALDVHQLVRRAQYRPQLARFRCR